MKRAVMLFVFLVCVLLFLASCSSNPFAVFDPEGAIVKGYIGMTEEQIVNADKDLSYTTSTTGGYFYKKKTPKYLFDCDIENGKVNLVMYMYTYDNSSDSYEGVETSYRGIRAQLGDPASNTYSGSNLTSEDLQMSGTTTVVATWEKSGKPRVSLIFAFSNGQGLLMVTIGAKVS